MIDSSILAVPSISTANVHADAVVEQQRLAGLDHVAGQALADPRPEDLGRAPVRRGQLALERDRCQVVALADEDAAVVVVDQLPQLVRDRHPDLADVVRAVELAGERLQHLQVRDRADVLAAAVWPPAGRSVSDSSKKTTWFLPRAFAVIIAASAQATSSRGLAACSGPCAIPIETRDPPGELELDLVEPLREPAARA